MSASTSLNTGVPARDFGYYAVQCLTKTVNFATLGIGTADTVVVGTLPAGSMVLHSGVRITTAFNASTNVLVVGQSSASNADIIAAGDVDETALAGTIVARGSGLTFANDTTIYALYTQTGTPATAGVAVITVTYVVVPT